MTASTDICNALYALARERNGENVELDIEGVPVLVVQRAEDMDRVLRSHVAHYKKNMLWFRQTLGASRLSEDDDAWRVRRDLTQRYFNRFDRERTFRLATHHAQTAVRALAEASARGAVNLEGEALRTMALSTLSENFLDLPLESTGLRAETVSQLLARGSAYSFVPPAADRARRSTNLLELQALRRDALAQMRGLRAGTAGHGNALLDGLRDADADAASPVVLEHELLSFFFAGALSTTATAGWLCETLARHPDVQAQLRALAQDFWRGGAGPQDWAHLSRIGPLAAFVSETLRLFPPVPIVSRIAVEADRLGTHAVAPQGRVMVSFIGVQHDLRLRADPWTVDLDAAARQGYSAGSGAGTAFSTGIRACGGRNVAMVELVSILSVLCASARFELTSDAPPRYVWGTVMTREGGHPVRVTLMDEAPPAVA